MRIAIEVETFDSSHRRIVTTLLGPLSPADLVTMARYGSPEEDHVPLVFFAGCDQRPITLRLKVEE